MTAERERLYIKNRARLFEAMLRVIKELESAPVRGSSSIDMDGFGIKMTALGVYKDLVKVGQREHAREIMRQNGFLKVARDKVDH